MTAALSNLVSNVPAVLVIKPFVEPLPKSRHAWLTIAMASTLAGNFTILGSIANLIVVQKAAQRGVNISFWDYFRGRRPAHPAHTGHWDALAMAVSAEENRRVPSKIGRTSVGMIWLYPVIVIAGILQALGPPMNGQLRQSLVNPGSRLWSRSVSSLPFLSLSPPYSPALCPRRRGLPPCRVTLARRHYRRICGRHWALSRRQSCRPVRRNDRERQSHHVGDH